ncbi:Ig-like domain-containing protein [Cytobacillus sp. IB215316]|uniref:Ig-like domain-containing protein n=1 Tax=Cytobacillus sp. IB215316 TaxID=3097354 RepID=UPI002A1247A0|nr:Ig-like domain-containing protein [Cytobacillus sp. IB215316]MDX8361134.1 Ig-like domain-containing protein [Cytobacillus sp. IB215316]
MNNKIVVFFVTLFVILALAISFPNDPLQASDPELWEESNINDPLKRWEISFNEQVRTKSVAYDRVYIIDNQNKLLKTDLQVSSNGKTIMITPLEQYKTDTKYWLYIDKSVRSVNMDPLKKSVIMPFSLSDQVATGGSPIAVKNDVQNTSTADSQEQAKMTIQVEKYDMFADVTVTTSSNVQSVLMDNITMQYVGNNTFNLGIVDIMPGDELNFKALDQNGKVLENIKHEVR